MKCGPRRTVHLRSILLFNALLLSLVWIPAARAQSSAPAVVRGGFNDPAILNTWYRTDDPQLVVNTRPHIWGPAILRKWQEPYKEAPGGARIVVYFDKARMEITNADAPRNSGSYVTNGLLVRELISGEVQTGDTTFEARTPADTVPVAGDALVVNAQAPTYATLGKIASLRNDNPGIPNAGSTVVQTLDAQGQLGSNPALSKYNVTLGDFDPVLKHNIAAVFSAFFARQGPVYEDGAVRQGTIMDAMATVGRPLTEPVWVRAKVRGVEQDVLVQAFERRVLTYTPSNPAAFQVEMGNVGLHYYRWRYGRDPFPFRNEVVGANGALVATANPYATDAGVNILAAGGNAVDAAIAVMFALTAVEPQSSGIGGGGFMLIRLKDGTTTMVDTREIAPAGATPTMFLDAEGNPLPFGTASTSGTAVGVPGAIKGAADVLQRFGKLSLARVLQPASDLAEGGFVITPRFAEALSDPGSVAKLRRSPAAAAIFLPGGNPLPAGTYFKQPDLAKTFKLLAAEGPDAFYGDTPLGRALVQAVQERGGSMTVDDLKSYAVKYRAPVRDTYRGHEIIAAAPPSSGGLTMMQILKLLEPYPLREMGQNSAAHLHLLTEATRLAFADRGKYMGDEDFVAIPKRGLLDKRYLDERRKLINMDTANRNVTAGTPEAFEDASTTVSAQQVDGRETSHFVVADKDGNVVSFTNTIESGYGTGIMVPGYGFLLNNELTDFDFRPGGPNQVAPGKRPRSSMNPTIVVKDGRPFMALGSPGGSSIILSVTEVLMNVIDFGMDLQDAIDAPRTFGPTFPTITWETGIAADVRTDLTRRGHTMAERPAFIGSVQAVMFDPSGAKRGGADWRRDGMVIGLP